jgi:biotin carboxyl carrier protein
MYTILINEKESIKTNLQINGNLIEGLIGEKNISANLQKINSHQFHLLHNHQSYNIELIKLNEEEKTMILKINTVKYNVQLKDKYDELLHNLGLDISASKKINHVKAPMPGMVLNVLVKEGDMVKKGDALLVLEAMKMENIIKSPTEGQIKRIIVTKGAAVEKNQLLIQF